MRISDSGSGGPAGDLPDAGPFFIELRTHGVSGTSPEGILGSEAQVVFGVGDKQANFWRRKQRSDAERYRRVGLTEWRSGDEAPAGDAPAVIVEGYRWGDLTAGSARKALWAFLFPFALANLAAWLVPPPREDGGMSARRAGLLRFIRRVKGRSIRKDPGTRSGTPAGVIRVFGVLLTGLFVMQAVIIVADLMAAQCISRQSTVCLNGPGPLSWARSAIRWFAVHPLPLALTIGILIGMLVGLATLLTIVPRPRPQVSDSAEPDAATSTAGTTTISPKPGLGEASFIDGDDPRIPALRSLHALAAFAAAILLLSADDGTVGNGWWWAGATMAAVSVVGALFLGPGSGPLFKAYMAVFGGVLRGWATFVVALALWVAFSGSELAGRLDDASSTTRLIGDGGTTTLTTLLLALAGCAVVLLLSLLLFRVRVNYTNRAPDVPPAFRPWLYGTASVAMLGFTAMLGAGMGTGLATITTNTLAEASQKTPDGKRLLVLRTPWLYDAIGMFWGIVAVLAFITMAVALLIFWCRPTALIGTHLRTIAQRIQYGQNLDELDQPKAHIRTWVVGNAKAHGYLIVVGLTVYGLIALPFAFSDSLLLHDDLPHPWVNTLKSVGILLLLSFAVFLFGAVYTASKKPNDHGRRLGVIWDLASFWPREAHPVVPGEYAPRAVNDIIGRIRTHLRHDNARIILCGHSQGSVIMYAVVLQLIRTEPALLGRIGLITYGSPLQWAYTRGFPAMLSYESHKEVAQRLGGGWRNIIRATDPIGGPVLTWNHSTVVVDGAVLSMAANHVPQGTDAPPDEFVRLGGDHPEPGAHVVGNEYWITDPDVGDPTGTTRAHSDYFHDPVWPRVVADTVTDLQRP